jgi:hypothetical protein
VTDNARRADIVAVMGATGAGKSSTICAALAADDGPRRLIYDPGEDYGAFGDICPSIQVVYDRVVRAGAGPFRLVFRPPFDLVRARAEFNLFCLIAFRVCMERGDVLVVADELEDVTLASWAPPGWSQLIRKGRKHGARIIAASQRPAGIEKKIWSMATVVQSGRLNELEDARTVARVLMVDPLEVIALPQLSWIRRSIYKPAIVRGRIEWVGGRPREVIISEKPLPFPSAV